MLDRRAVLRVLGLSLLAGAAPAQAQRTRTRTIGYVSFGGPSSFQEAFRSGLRELGYVEGQNILVEYRYAHGSQERLDAAAAELIALRVDLIVAQSTQAIDATRRATKTIPIVFPVTFDPVASGFVESLARPGGNLTGLTPLNPELTAKRVQLIHEVIPQLARLAVLRNPTNAGSALVLHETERAAQRVGVQLHPLEVRGPNDLEGAFRAATGEHAGAVMVLTDNLFFRERRRIVELANRHRLPQIFDTKDFVQGGGLVSYGADLDDLYRRAATYVDKILKGSRPATLPVEQATKFELVVNLKTARLLSVTVPPSVLVRADQLIE
jgi:putative tryptophan/tyrosine transport system substrate-binding protein